MFARGVNLATVSLRRWLCLGDTLLGLFDVLRLGMDYSVLSLKSVSLGEGSMEESRGLVRIGLGGP